MDYGVMNDRIII